MTQILPLCKCNAEDYEHAVRRIAEHERDYQFYADTFGAVWQLKIQSDLVAYAVNWMARDYIDIFGYLGDEWELMDAFVEYDYLELFDAFPDFKPSEAIGLALARTYIDGLIDYGDYIDVWY